MLKGGNRILPHHCINGGKSTVIESVGDNNWEGQQCQGKHGPPGMDPAGSNYTPLVMKRRLLILWAGFMILLWNCYYFRCGQPVVIAPEENNGGLDRSQVVRWRRFRTVFFQIHFRTPIHPLKSFTYQHRIISGLFHVRKLIFIEGQWMTYLKRIPACNESLYEWKFLLERELLWAGSYPK